MLKSSLKKAKNPLFPAAIAIVNIARHSGRVWRCPARRRGSSRERKGFYDCYLRHGSRYMKNKLGCILPYSAYTLE
jgi:hypothetical protein